ncbi:MAG: helix-turn-helix domain-containing protein [Acidobacteriota bacterium]
MRNTPHNLVSGYVMDRIRFFRLMQRRTLNEAARRSGIPLGSYSCLETKRYRLSLDNLLRLQLVLGVEIGDLWPKVTGKCNLVTDEVLLTTLRAARGWLPKRITIIDVLLAIREVYGLDQADLVQPSRRRDLAEARAVAARLVQEQPGLAVSDLARLFGRDPSSLFHCLRRLPERLTYDKHLLERLGEARRLLV